MKTPKVIAVQPVPVVDNNTPNKDASSINEVIDHSKFLRLLEKYTELFRNAKNGSTQTSQVTGYLLVVVFISALIFISVNSIYDVVKISVSNLYTETALLNVQSTNKIDDIERTITVNEHNLKASALFATICVLSTITILLLTFKILH